MGRYIEIDGRYEYVNEVVKNPKHYQVLDSIEAIQIIASSMTKQEFKGYCLGNIIKYRLRAGNKDDTAQDIAKANQYIKLYDKYLRYCR